MAENVLERRKDVLVIMIPSMLKRIRDDDYPVFSRWEGKRKYAVSLPPGLSCQLCPWPLPDQCGGQKGVCGMVPTMASATF